jgi:hypothetical protein
MENMTRYSILPFAMLAIASLGGSALAQLPLQRLALVCPAVFETPV